MAQDIDLAWQPLARSTRQALRLLDYEIFSDCLPDEAQPCGGSFAAHTAAHLATLRAVVEYRIAHLGEGAGPVVEAVYAGVLAELREGDPCEQGHHS